MKISMDIETTAGKGNNLVTVYRKYNWFEKFIAKIVGKHLKEIETIKYSPPELKIWVNQLGGVHNCKFDIDNVSGDDDDFG